MNLLTICHDHPDFTPAGTEIFANALTRAIAATGTGTARFLGVTTALTRPDDLPGQISQHGEDFLLRTGRYDPFAMERLDGTRWATSLVDLVSGLEIDVVHFHGLDRIGASAVTLLRQRFPGLTLVLSLHDYGPICANDGLLLRRHDGGLCERPAPDACWRCFPDISISRHALRAAHLRTILSQIDAFIAPSRNIRDRFVAWGLPQERTRVLPVGTSTAPGAAPPAKRFGGDKRPNRFGYFGNLGQHKGIDVLLEAAALLRSDEAKLCIDIHGDIPYATSERRDAFERRCRELAPIVQYLGPYATVEVSSHMSGVDWVVLPALWPENAPLALREAQNARRPIICTPVGGLTEMVRDGIDGLFVPRGDARQLAATMRRASDDPALWARLQAAVKPGPDMASIARMHLSLFDDLALEAIR